MPVYTFSGKSASGEKISGERTAESKAAMQSALRRERITVTGAIKEKGKEFALPKLGGGKVSAKEVAIFFRQFSVMIDAGLPLVQCLEILAANQENASFQKTLTGVRTTVEGGATLLQSFIGEGCWDEARVITNEDLHIGEGLSAPVMQDPKILSRERFFSDTICYYQNPATRAEKTTGGVQ